MNTKLEETNKMYEDETDSTREEVGSTHRGRERSRCLLPLLPAAAAAAAALFCSAVDRNCPETSLAS